MNTELTLTAETRALTGNGPARRLRKQGRVPAVVYGHGKAGIPLTVQDLALRNLIHHPGLINVAIDGGAPISAIVKDVQRDCISGHILHVDFQEVLADEIIVISVQIESLGDPAGIQAGGQLEQVMRLMDVKVRAKDVTDVVQIDVTKMQLNETMHVRELVLPEGMTAVTHGDAAVFQVRLPKIEEEAATDEAVAVEGAEGAGEPEVIAKGKKPEDGEEGADAAAGGKEKAGAKEKGKEKDEKKK